MKQKAQLISCLRGIQSTQLRPGLPNPWAACGPQSDMKIGAYKIKVIIRSITFDMLLSVFATADRGANQQKI